MNHIPEPYADILIIGAGAAGMTAAVTAASELSVSGSGGDFGRIVIIERHSISGRKILATGNGTCNLSNVNASADRIRDHYRGREADKAGDILEAFSPEDAVSFFGKLGIECETESDGRIYPYCRQASAVRNALEEKLADLGVYICCKTEIRMLSYDPAGYFIADAVESDIKDFKDRSGSVRRSEVQGSSKLRSDILSSRHIYARRVIIAAGGKASPALSSDGLGYSLCEGFGHTVERLYPAIVKLVTEPVFRSDVSGVRLDARLKLAGPDGKSALDSDETGEILFTERGLSGPAVLQISGRIIPEMAFRLFLDMMPYHSENDLMQLLLRRMTDLAGRRIRDFLEGLLPDKLGRAVTEDYFRDRSRDKVSSLTGSDIKGLISLMKNKQVVLTGTDGWKEAQITSGGIPLSEIDTGTMESLLRPGLYLAGEILDVTGDCGGYNLQFAWASGHIAGRAAADL